MSKTRIQGFGSMLKPAEPLPAEDPLESIARDIRRVREKVDPGPTEKVASLDLAAGGYTTISSDQADVNCLTVTLLTGTVYVWYGDASSRTTQPTFVFAAQSAVNPVQIALAQRRHRFTIYSAAGSTGMAVLQAL